MSKKIETIRRLIKKECKEHLDYFWDYHMVPMVKYSLQLADKIGANKEIVEISAWLHDISWLRGNYSDNHNITGSKQAEEVLKKLNYPDEKINKVKHCILAHRGTIKRRTKEAECIASADTMAHFDAIPALFYLAYTKQGMDIEGARSWLLDKFKRGWKKLIPEAKELVKDKYEAVKKLI